MIVVAKVIDDDVSTAIRNRVHPDPDYNEMAERLDEAGLSVVRHSRRWFTVRKEDTDIVEVYINRYTALNGIDTDLIAQEVGRLLARKRKFAESHQNSWDARWNKKKR